MAVKCIRVSRAHKKQTLVFKEQEQMFTFIR